MASDEITGWREVEQWLSASVAEAERELPRLLDLPPHLLRQELEERPELRTPGMIQSLLDVVHKSLERFPVRTLELTSTLVIAAAGMEVPPPRRSVARRLQGQAWTEHARALLTMRRLPEAAEAIALARELFRQTPASGWYVATADLLDARIQHDLGRRDEALRLAGDAASLFALGRDHDRYLQARALEVWMLWTGGDRDAATRIWETVAGDAVERGDELLLAHLHRKVGVLELRYGSAQEAASLLAAALHVFVKAGLREEAVRAGWNYAEAVSALGRPHEAISEFYKVQAELLSLGHLVDAALASAEILELLLLAGREGEALRLADTLVFTFNETGLSLNALEAFTWLRACARRGELTREAVKEVRWYFEDLPQQPNARFRGAR
jgi:tetratricopeptide (TPR) repeat protein